MQVVPGPFVVSAISMLLVVHTMLVMTTVAQGCPLEIWVYDTMDNCLDWVSGALPLARGSVQADGTCRSTMLVQGTANELSLFPGIYSATCVTDGGGNNNGQVRFVESGCATETCAPTGATCIQQFEGASWLYARVSPAVYDVQDVDGNRVSCRTLSGSRNGDPNNTVTVAFAVFGDCLCETETPTSVPTLAPTSVPTIVPTTARPSLRPSTTAPTQIPTTQPTVPPSSFPTTQTPTNLPTNIMTTEQPTVEMSPMDTQQPTNPGQQTDTPIASTLAPSGNPTNATNGTVDGLDGNRSSVAQEDDNNTTGSIIIGASTGILVLGLGLVAYYMLVVRRRSNNDKHNSEAVGMANTPVSVPLSGNNDTFEVTGALSNDWHYSHDSAQVVNSGFVIPHAMTPMSGKELELFVNGTGDDVSTLGEPVGLSSDASTRHDASTASVQLSYVQHEIASNSSQAPFRSRDGPSDASTNNMLQTMSVTDDDDASFAARLRQGHDPLALYHQNPGIGMLPANPSSRNSGARNLADETTTINSSTNSSSLEGLKFLNDSQSGSSSKNASSQQQQQQQQQPQLYQVQVPPGRLGLLLEGSTVRAIAPDCIFATRVQVGDVLVDIDGTRVQHLSQGAIASVVQETAHEPRRCFTFARAGSIAGGARKR